MFITSAGHLQRGPQPLSPVFIFNFLAIPRLLLCENWIQVFHIFQNLMRNMICVKHSFFQGILFAFKSYLFHNLKQIDEILCEKVALTNL